MASLHGLHGKKTKKWNSFDCVGIVKFYYIVEFYDIRIAVMDFEKHRMKDTTVKSCVEA